MRFEVQFRSAGFPAYEKEETEVNPNRWGKRLVEFFSRGLQDQHLQTGEPYAEDWGWELPIKDEDVSVFIGCGNIDGTTDSFLCFVESGRPKGLRWFKKVDNSKKLLAITEALDKVLRANPEIHDIQWDDNLPMSDSSGKNAK
jgi:hypothetical protein